MTSPRGKKRKKQPGSSQSQETNESILFFATTTQIIPDKTTRTVKGQHEHYSVSLSQLFRNRFCEYGTHSLYIALGSPPGSFRARNTGVKRWRTNYNSLRGSAEAIRFLGIQHKVLGSEELARAGRSLSPGSKFTWHCCAISRVLFHTMDAKGDMASSNNSSDFVSRLGLWWKNDGQRLTYYLSNRFANCTSKHFLKVANGREWSGCWWVRSRMLEDPSYESIVRWGENGDSFVVLEVYLHLFHVAFEMGLTVVDRTRNSRNPSSPNTSNTPTLQVSSANWTSMTSTRSGRTMRGMGQSDMVSVYVVDLDKVGRGCWYVRRPGNLSTPNSKPTTKTL